MNHKSNHKKCNNNVKEGVTTILYANKQAKNCSCLKFTLLCTLDHHKKKQKKTRENGTLTNRKQSRVNAFRAVSSFSPARAFSSRRMQHYHKIVSAVLVFVLGFQRRMLMEVDGKSRFCRTFTDYLTKSFLFISQSVRSAKLKIAKN